MSFLGKLNVMEGMRAPHNLLTNLRDTFADKAEDYPQLAAVWGIPEDVIDTVIDMKPTTTATLVTEPPVTEPSPDEPIVEALRAPADLLTNIQERFSEKDLPIFDFLNNSVVQPLEALKGERHAEQFSGAAVEEVKGILTKLLEELFKLTGEDGTSADMQGTVFNLVSKFTEAPQMVMDGALFNKLKHVIPDAQSELDEMEGTVHDLIGKLSKFIPTEGGLMDNSIMDIEPVTEEMQAAMFNLVDKVRALVPTSASDIPTNMDEVEAVVDEMEGTAFDILDKLQSLMPTGDITAEAEGISDEMTGAMFDIFGKLQKFVPMPTNEAPAGSEAPSSEDEVSEEMTGAMFDIFGKLQKLLPIPTEAESEAPESEAPSSEASSSEADLTGQGKKILDFFMNQADSLGEEAEELTGAVFNQGIPMNPSEIQSYVTALIEQARTQINDLIPNADGLIDSLLAEFMTMSGMEANGGLFDVYNVIDRVKELRNDIASYIDKPYDAFDGIFENIIFRLEGGEENVSDVVIDLIRSQGEATDKVRSYYEDVDSQMRDIFAEIYDRADSILGSVNVPVVEDVLNARDWEIKRMNWLLENGENYLLAIESGLRSAPGFDDFRKACELLPTQKDICGKIVASLEDAERNERQEFFNQILTNFENTKQLADDVLALTFD